MVGDDKLRPTPDGQSGQASGKTGDLIQCPNPERIAGASQEPEARYSRQRKEPEKRLYPERQASHGRGHRQ